MIKRYSKNQIEELALILQNDGIISVPTDTVYGICGKITSEIAHDKLAKTKNRPENKSFPVMCKDEEQIKEIAIVNENAEKLINAFMPGPITLVMKKKPCVPDYVTNGKDTIAIRMATSKELEELIEKVGVPIFMTSANKSGEKTATTLDEIEGVCPTLDGMLEGEVSFGEASTIVDCTTKQIKILRSGPISEEILKNYSIIF